ncbi:hypothetical protein JTB14_034355 [Gonioctena quinquepunctata]|nr:hypothetical protein JTB14_034355 [Gonioctena quinquepunctata]
MDSFYDMPRNVPIPTNIEKCLLAPVVPEVSMLCASNTSEGSTYNHRNYNLWKSHQRLIHQTNVLTSVGKHSLQSDRRPFPTNQHLQFQSPQNSSQFLRKQVRFESPSLQQRPSLTYEPFMTRKKESPNHNMPHSTSTQEIQKISSSTFEKMYMANIPNRKLDLSIIDLPKLPAQVEKRVEGESCPEEREVSCYDCVENQGISDFDTNIENDLPKTYKDFFTMQKNASKETHSPNDSVTDIFNYKRNINSNKSEQTYFPKRTNVSSVCEEKLEGIGDNNFINNESRNHLNESWHFELNKYYNLELQSKTREEGLQSQGSKIIGTPTSPKNLFFQNSKISNEKTVREMQSNDIGLSLQPNPSSLKVIDDSEPSSRDLLKIIAQQNEQLLLLQSQVALLLNRDQQKQIVGVPQKSDYIREKKRGMPKFSIDLMTSFEVAIRPQHKPNFINYEPKIQEIAETDNILSDKSSEIQKNTYQSYNLEEPVAVQETCPSPEPSININMNDYDSSEDELSASEISATFYNNLMGQVNNILKKAQIQTRDDLVFKQERKMGVNINKNKTLHRVREATLKHLKNMGVTIGPLDDTYESTSSENGEKNCGSTDISLAVKQLLMKYLPDDQLAKISCKREQAAKVDNKEPGIMTARPEFSLASVQYMKKYNLIESEVCKEKCIVNEPKPWRVPHSQMENPKILDMTALQMQPKLL